MIFDLIPDSDPRLHSAVPEFDFSNPPTDPVALYSDMMETMRSNHGAGLAANQCGLPYRAFTAYDMESQHYIAFNPTIEVETGEQKGTEGCLSYPGLILTITRAFTVTLRYQDQHGEWKTKELSEFRARAALHETDHLNGITFVEKVSKFRLKEAMAARKKA